MHQRADYLKSVLSALRNDLVPELSTDLARNRAELIDFVLTRLVAEFSIHPQLLDEYSGAIAKAVEDNPIPRSALQAEPVENISESLTPEAENSESPVRDQQSAAAIMQSLLAETMLDSNGEEAARNSRERLVAAVATAEADYRTAFEAHVAAESHRIRGSTTHLVPEHRMTDDSLTAYLKRRFPDQPGIRAIGTGSKCYFRTRFGDQLEALAALSSSPSRAFNCWNSWAFPS